MQIISNIVACVQAKAHCIRANVEHDSLDTAVVLTLLLMDIGWVLGHPMLALPTLVLGLSLQSMVLYFSVQGFVFYRRKGTLTPCSFQSLRWSRGSSATHAGCVRNFSGRSPTLWEPWVW